MVQLNDTEKLADERFLQVQLPGDSWPEAAWSLMAASDDMPRFGLIGVSMKPREEFERIGQAVVFQFFDEFKYAIRHALLRARKLDAGKHVWGRTLDEANHGVAGAAVMAARDYGNVCRAFASCHENLSPYT
jgi:hypothetical protein